MDTDHTAAEDAAAQALRRPDVSEDTLLADLPTCRLWLERRGVKLP